MENHRSGVVGEAPTMADVTEVTRKALTEARDVLSEALYQATGTTQPASGVIDRTGIEQSTLRGGQQACQAIAGEILALSHSLCREVKPSGPPDQLLRRVS